METLLKQLARIPGALMIVPLFLGAVVASVAPQALEIGSFTTALFKSGTAVLIGLFFVCVGSQIDFRAALPAVEKGMVLLLAKFGIAVAVGLSVAFAMPDGTLWGMLPAGDHRRNVEFERLAVRGVDQRVWKFKRQGRHFGAVDQ